MKRILKSTLVWTVVMVIAASVALAHLLPFDCFRAGKLAGSAAQFDQAGKKVRQYFSTGEPADILLIGSSTFLFSAARSDELLRGQQPRYDTSYLVNNISNYQSANYFEKRLSDNFDRPVRVANLGTAGGVISDQYCVFRKACVSKKKPRLVICDISPREFLDPIVRDPAGTPVYAATADLACVGDLFDSLYSQDSVSSSMLGSFWQVYRERNLLRSVLSNSISLLSGRSESLWRACSFSPSGERLKDAWSRVRGHLFSRAPESQPSYVRPDNLAADLKHYQYMYQARDEKSIAKQFAFLERLLQYAKKEKVSVCLVQMPLTNVNLQLLPDNVTASIYSRAKALAQKYEASYIQPDATTYFSDADFEDSAHLNAHGGRKLFDSLASAATMM